MRLKNILVPFWIHNAAAHFWVPFLLFHFSFNVTYVNLQKLVIPATWFVFCTFVQFTKQLTTEMLELVSTLINESVIFKTTYLLVSCINHVQEAMTKVSPEICLPTPIAQYFISHHALLKGFFSPFFSQKALKSEVG